jgi:hypothetical protein
MQSASSRCKDLARPELKLTIAHHMSAEPPTPARCYGFDTPIVAVTNPFGLALHHSQFTSGRLYSPLAIDSPR